MPRARFLTVAVAVVVASLLPAPAAAASFPSVVRSILDAQTDGRLAKMGAERRLRMTDCVIATLNGLPNGKKRFVVEGANFEEQEHRFGDVLEEDRAKWKKKIAAACSRIAIEQDNNNNN